MTLTGTKVAAKVLKGRRRAKLTQQELAEKAGLSISYVSMIERARREPSFAALEALARALGMTVSRLVA